MKKLGPKAKAVIGPMARLLPKPMKPKKAWAAVDAKGNFVDGSLLKRLAALRNPGYRIARVVITEVVK